MTLLTNQRKPKFMRQDAHKKKRLTKKWRKPKGIQSKMREMRNGHATLVKIGFRSPSSDRGRYKNGKELIRVQTLPELENINKDNQIAIVAAVGMKRKRELLQKALDLQIDILNVKNAKASLSIIDKTLTNNKSKRSALLKSKESKKKVEEKESKEKLDEKVETEEKSNKKELDKLLTKKQ